MVLESLKEKRRAYSKSILAEIPDDMDQLYRNSAMKLSEDDRQTLFIVLRWLICGCDSIEVEWVADEYERLYEDDHNDEDDNDIDHDDEDDEDDEDDDNDSDGDLSLIHI